MRKLEWLESAVDDPDRQGSRHHVEELMEGHVNFT
jgi:hypothetical protein